MSIMFNTSEYLDGYQKAETQRFERSPPMDCLHEAARQYRVQSPDHFELQVMVQQISEPYGKSANTDPRDNSLTMFIDVLFCGNTIEGPLKVPVQCHLQRSGFRSRKKRWTCLAVAYNGTAEDPDSFLNSKFPIFDAHLQPDTLWKWWLANSKSFNWAALPTELKERIIEHCMHRRITHGKFEERLARFNWHYKDVQGVRKPGPFEIVEQLGDWFSILYVSHQVRAITMRLCITGSGELIRSEGLTIIAESYKGVRDRLTRLGDCY